MRATQKTRGKILFRRVLSAGTRVAMLAVVVMLAQCETDATEDVATDTTSPTTPTNPTTTPEPTCSASGFTEIQATMDICAICHVEPSNDDMPILSDSETAADNATELEKHYKDGGKLYDYIVGNAHPGHGNIEDEGIKRAEYEPWCIE